MSTVATEPLYHVELIGGREVEKPMPQKLHAFVQTYLIRKLGRELPQQYRVVSELNILTGGRTPDRTPRVRCAGYYGGRAKRKV